jgi:hypothetical protein
VTTMRPAALRGVRPETMPDRAITLEVPDLLTADDAAARAWVWDQVNAETPPLKYIERWTTYLLDSALTLCVEVHVWYAELDMPDLWEGDQA